VKIISFSGIDGAGKTTQIAALECWLREAGMTTALLTFWDEVVVGTRLREFMSYAAFKGDQGVGSPERPLQRRDKNVTAWPLTAFRMCLYLADAASARLKVAALKGSEVDVLIFDRYIYDELANLPLNSIFIRAFIRVVLKLVRRPDVALVIDADPEAARARKPEYPLEFIRKNRHAYLELARLTKQITVIEPLPIDAAAKKIREAFLRVLPRSEKKFCGLPAIE
jgi:thymidylate kinase